MAQNRFLRVSCLLFSIFCFLISSVALADEFVSADFKMLDPVVSFPAGFSSSLDFRLQGLVSQSGIGESSDGGTSFGVKSGFLYFPFSSTPVVTPTAGDAQVGLTWTTASTALGWTVGGYNVGQSTVSGGPYVYTSVGNVTSSTRTGLTNGIIYYFVVRAEDLFGNSIATSTEVSATPVAGAPAPTPTPTPTGGGPILDIYRRLFEPIISIFKPCRRSDLNCDGRVDLYDIGILFYWWQKPIGSGPFLSRIAALVGLGKPSPDLKADGKVDIYDLSVMLKDWTG